MMQIIYPESFIAENSFAQLDKAQLPTTNDIVKKHTENFGIGIYAVRSFQRGETIGQFVAQQTNELLQHTLQRMPNDNLHDPYFVGMLLHSCDPNIVVDMHQQRVFCIRDIQAGGPLFMDYASTEDTLFNQFGCQCGASNCRNWITGRNEMVNSDGVLHLRKVFESNVIQIEPREVYSMSMARSKK